MIDCFWLPVAHRSDSIVFYIELQLPMDDQAAVIQSFLLLLLLRKQYKHE